MLEMSTKQSLSCGGDIIDILVSERRDNFDRIELFLLPVGIARGPAHQSSQSRHETHHSRNETSLSESSIPSEQDLTRTSILLFRNPLNYLVHGTTLIPHDRTKRGIRLREDLMFILDL